jgi:hypothetical protein
MKNKADLIAEIESIKKFETKRIAIDRYGNENLRDFVIDRKFKAVVIEGETDIITTVTDKYRLIQFRDVFVPAIQNIPEFEGHISTYKGRATLFVFPQGDTFTGEKNSRIGIQLKNSVDKSSAVEVGFAVLFSGYCIGLPTEQKKFRKIHTGKALELTTDFLEGLDGIKNAWKTVVEKYSEYTIDEETKESIYKDLKLTKGVRERINEKEIKNLWELFIETLGEITKKQFKSDIHKQRKIEKIVGIFFQFSIGAML